MCVFQEGLESQPILVPLQQELLQIKHWVYCNTKDRHLLGATSFRVRVISKITEMLIH